MTEEIRRIATLDVDTLANYLAVAAPALAGNVRVRPVAGGQSNPTFFLDCPDASYVLRKQPPGQLLPSAHAVDREYRVMDALRATDIPVPKMIHYCADRSVLGTPFFIMEAVEGRVFHDMSLPGLTPAERAIAYDSVADTLADLHSVDVASIGLADYGRGNDYYGRQLRRWAGQYANERTRDLPGMEELIGWLSRNQPADDQAATICHGDYRVGNLILGLARPTVRAVIDWELSTLGNPMADLAHCLMFWRIGTDDYGGLADQPLAELGIPSEERFVERYFRRRGVPNSLTNFHRSFALFRFALIAEGIAVRARKGNANSANADALGDRAARFTRAALDLATGSALLPS